MTEQASPPSPEPDNGAGIPVESVTLQRAYKQSGLTAADLAAATGMSIGAVRIALAGVRYRNGEARTAIPPDATVAKLASVLGVTAGMLTALGRGRAAAMMAEIETADIDLETPAAIAGRHSLAKQVLGIFTTEELETEVKRRRWQEQYEADNE
ncbi:hypothetical protein CGZ95_08975 [Enemella evansiae]|uniref:hypothetical protein n=1 Tax=Enemella evansiae TaxID=2016499 RepID=UPI000B977186|nr:hypothetical protein [Enemella evansiae]OYO00745.1 hypothetical protein CGZ95_08975 [Enemella evansiae]